MKCCSTCKNQPTRTGPSVCDNCIGSKYIPNYDNLFEYSGIDKYRAKRLEEKLTTTGILTKEDIEDILGRETT